MALSELLSAERDRNEAASVWMHRGMDLAESGSPGVLDEAIRCFDEAIALRRTLPLAGNPLYRYGLSAGWINRGDAWARREDTDALDALDEAIRSYGEALALLETLPLRENPLYPRRLAIARLNQGVALQRRQGAGDLAGAAAAFRHALDVLGKFPGFAPDHPQLHAAAWSNLAGALAAAGGTPLDDARAAARHALDLARPSEADDATSAETALAARQTLCRLAVRDLAGNRPLSDALAAEATDAVEEALDAIGRWRARGVARLAARGPEIVRLGCRIYGSAQPRFLAEFLVDHLGLGNAEAGPLDPETFAAAQAGIWSALDRLQAHGFHSPILLEEVRGLRAAQERLGRRAPAGGAGPGA